MQKIVVPDGMCVYRIPMPGRLQHCGLVLPPDLTGQEARRLAAVLLTLTIDTVPDELLAALGVDLSPVLSVFGAQE
jgi:hypothetical protein